jgi:hypothetical protein
MVAGEAVLSPKSLKNPGRFKIHGVIDGIR